MNVALILSSSNIFRYFDGVVRELCGNGHAVTVVSRSGPKPERALQACLAEKNGCEYMHLLYRTDRWWRLTLIRNFVEYGNYLGPQHPSQARIQTWSHKFPPTVQLAVRNPLVRRVLTNDKVCSALRQVERIIPPVYPITRWLVDKRPDVVVASPVVPTASPDFEYIKAAKALKIPTVAAVKTWDNLTTRGTFHIVPDWTLVWNHRMVEQATTLHAVPKEQILVTGAPVFDFWFEMHPSPRETFCQKLGIDPGQTFVAYVASALKSSEPEPVFVRELATSLLSDADGRRLTVVVRPHPWLPSIWRGFSVENVVVWPPEGNLPDTPELKQDYYDTLFHSAAVVGLNTTAQVEGAIANRPCVAIISDRYHSDQTDLGHFRLLLEEGFLETVRDFAECRAILERLLRGTDERKANRQRFVREFVRPWGLDTSASHVVARVIEAIGKRQMTSPDIVPQLVASKTS